MKIRLNKTIFLRPAQIFNADESGIPLSPQSGKRVGIRGSKRVYCVSSGVKSNITVLCCANAAGYAIPPLVIFKRQNLLPSLTVGQVPGTAYGLNAKSGWINGEIFRDWFHKHFLLHAPAARPLLLLLDGHSSHFEPDFIREAASQGVIVFALPPNTTHVCQPLDSTCFRSLKLHWGNACSEYLAANPGKIVTIYQFSKLFAAAFIRAFTPQNVISSFRLTGVFPPNRRAIPIPGFSGESGTAPLTPTAKLAKAKGIRFLPLFGSSKTDSSQLASSRSLIFTEEEVKRFERWYEEGYDLDTDDRYIKWLKVYHKHPVRSSSALETSFRSLNIQDLSEINGTTTTSYSSSPVEFRTTISEFLRVPHLLLVELKPRCAAKLGLLLVQISWKKWREKKLKNKLKRLKNKLKRSGRG